MDEFNECTQSTLKGSKIPQRWVTVGMGFLSFMSALSMRACLSIAITEMTSPHISTSINETNIEKKNHSNGKLEVIEHSINLKYDWSEETQGLILSSFYWGYITTCILGGMIVQKLGSKHTLGLNILLTSIFTLLTPTSIHWGGSTALIILRVAMGIGEGTAYPAVVDLLAHWIPEDERSKAGSVAFGGLSVGTIFGMFLSGVILQRSESGWPMVFYFYGTVGLISFLLIIAFCYNRPSENPYISNWELTYLKNKLRNVETNRPPTPWRHILKSPAVWALIFAKFSHFWVQTTIMSDMPKYMSSVHKFPVEDNGYFLSIPLVAKWISALLASWIADKVIGEKILSITIVRKIGCMCTLLGPSIFLVATTYVGNNGFVAVVLHSIGLVFMGCTFCSIHINSLDLSPNYASSIMGIGNGIGISAGAVAPYVVGVLTRNQTINEWRLVFCIVLAICATSSTVYLIYGNGEVQVWNNPAFLDGKKDSKEEHVESGVELLPLSKP